MILARSGEVDVRTNRILVVTTIVAVATLAANLGAQTRDDSAPLRPPAVLFMCPHCAATSVLAICGLDSGVHFRGNTGWSTIGGAEPGG